jgi:hypothetical protein
MSIIYACDNCDNKHVAVNGASPKHWFIRDITVKEPLNNVRRLIACSDKCRDALSGKYKIDSKVVNQQAALVNMLKPLIDKGKDNKKENGQQ